MTTPVPQSELDQCEQMLKNLLLPDNTIRKQAEAQLQNCLSSVKNKESLSLYCSYLLQNSSDLNVQTYCAIILRKVFLVTDDEISNEAIKNFTPETKITIKNNILSSLQNSKDKKIQKKIADAAINYLEGLMENEEKWDEFLKYIISIFQSCDLTDENLDKIELGLHLLSGVYNFSYDELKEGTNLFLEKFSIYFKSNNLSLKSKTVRCITELLCSTSSKKESKQFKDYIILILETTLKCLEASDFDNLKICLESILDLSNCEPKILRKNFGDIFILMGKIVENQALSTPENEDENIREIALEIIVAILEGMPKVINDNQLQLLVQSLFKYAMEIDQSIDEDWKTPNSVSFISDEFIPERKLDEATSLLSRLFEKLDIDKMLKLTSENIMELIKHSSENDWKYKYIAYITFAEILPFTNELSTVEPLIKQIFVDLEQNQNVKIKYACLYCIAELSDEKDPDFQNDYHSQVVPGVIKVLSENPCLRVKLECCDALDCFVEHMTDEDGKKYLQSSLEVLFGCFKKDDKETPPALKEGIMDVVQQFINICEDEFKKYSENCLNILLEYLSNILTKGINKNLIGCLLETISLIGPLCPELFKKYLEILVNTLIQINVNMPSFKENIATYLSTTWENIIPELKANNKEKIPQIIESLIELLKKPPEMTVSTGEKVNIQEFFADEEKPATRKKSMNATGTDGDEEGEINNNEKKENKKKEDKIELKTSETEEFAIFIEILNSFLSKCPEICTVAMVEKIYPISVGLLKYPNENIKGEISETFACCIDILIALNININQIHEASKKYIVEITTQLMKETSPEIVIDFVDSIKSIIKSTKLFLTVPEINDLSLKILELMEKVEQNRKNLINQKDMTEKQIAKDKASGENKIYSDDEDDNSSQEEAVEDIKEEIEENENVLTSISEFFGTLFDTHKELSLEIVKKLITEYFPKYFAETSSNFEKTLGLLLVDDMAEFLQQSIIPDIWGDIFNILKKYSDNKNNEIRNAACYGLGVFSKFTQKDFGNYVEDILKCLKNANEIKIDKSLPKNDRDTMIFAKDNAISSIGKIIKHHGNELANLNEVIDYWVKGLPITKDKEEGKINNEFLVEILSKEPSKVLGEGNKNLPNIIFILTKGYKTEASDEELDKKIEKIALDIKNEYATIVQEVMNKQTKEKLKNKIKSLYKL